MRTPCQFSRCHYVCTLHWTKKPAKKGLIQFYQIAFPGQKSCHAQRVLLVPPSNQETNFLVTQTSAKILSPFVGFSSLRAFPSVPFLSRMVECHECPLLSLKKFCEIDKFPGPKKNPSSFSKESARSNPCCYELTKHKCIDCNHLQVLRNFFALRFR